MDNPNVTSGQVSLVGLLSGLPISVYYFGSDMKIEWVNRTAAASRGFDDPSQMIGRSWYELVPEMSDRRGIYKRVLSGESLDFSDVEVIFDAGPEYFDVRYRPTEHGGMVAVSIDVTARHAAELQAFQASRLTALGRLAGGVAHDLNNHLTVILGALDLIHLEPSAATIRSAVESTERAADLVAQLLAFSRRRRIHPSARDLVELIEHVTERMLVPLLGEDVRVRLDLDSATGFVMVDATAFEQVLVNLAVNGREAMPRGGVLTIRSYPLKIDASSGQDWNLAAGEYAVMEVSDTGEGMDAETRAHCFDPFFTTKSGDTNTGLGLSTCYGVLQQMGGSILVEAPPGGGTTFRAVLASASSAPIAGAGAVDVAVEHGQLVSQRREDAMILVVDDDDRVRNIIAQYLTRAGYSILEASNARDALSAIDNHHGNVDLLLTDVVLPRVNGPSLVRRLRRTHPSLRVLYMSGFSDHSAVIEETATPDTVLLEKPFRGHELVAAVEKCLQVNGQNS